MKELKQKKMDRYMLLDKLFRNTGGYTYLDLVAKISNELGDVSERTILNDIHEFEEKGAIFVKEGLGKKTVIKYKDPTFTIFPSSSHDLDIIEAAIDKLHNTMDFRYENLVRLFLLQLRYGIEYADIQIMSIENSLDSDGVRYMEEIAKAIVNKYPIKLCYKPFNSEAFQTYVHPYHLKQYNNRWILLAWSEEKRRIYNYPIDRIQSVEHLDKKYISTDIDFNEYFDEIIGTTNREDQDVEDVILRVSKDSIKYIDTKPLHWSQVHVRELETLDDSYIKIRVKKNTELIMKLFSYNDAIEVISPKHLRDDMTEKLKNMMAKYKV